MDEPQRNRLARLAHKIEKFIDRFRPIRSKDDLVIDTYVGYGTPDGVVIRGRVLSRRDAEQVKKNSGIFSNIKDMISHFMSREVGDVDVEAEGIQARSDEEGYFSVTVPNVDPIAKFVTVRLPSQNYECRAPIVIPQPDAELGIISDIDDTIMQTGAFSLWRNLWTTLTGSVESRTVFSDTIALIRMRQGTKNPVFYVSSSPWNLHGFLEAVFHHNKVPFGPKFLRDFGISETQFITNTHGSHKGDSIDAIIAANPGLKFLLIGDTGQHDGQVYLDAIDRHGTTIVEVCLRVAGPVDDLDEEVAAKIHKTGVAFYTGRTFEPLLMGTN